MMRDTGSTRKVLGGREGISGLPQGILAPQKELLFFIGPTEAIRRLSFIMAECQSFLCPGQPWDTHTHFGIVGEVGMWK